MTGGIDNHVHRASARLCPRAARKALRPALPSSLLRGSVVVDTSVSPSGLLASDYRHACVDFLDVSPATCSVAWAKMRPSASARFALSQTSVIVFVPDPSGDPARVITRRLRLLSDVVLWGQLLLYFILSIPDLPPRSTSLLCCCSPHLYPRSLPYPCTRPYPRT